MASTLQGKLGNSRFQLRLQFKGTLTNNNGQDDAIRFGTPKLTVTYESP